jgi:peptide chain release factor 1
MYVNLMNEYLLQVRLGDPDIVSDPSEYQKLAQSVADLGEVCLA